jgi:hypothetical protein
MRIPKPLDVIFAERRIPKPPPLTHDRLGRPIVGPCLVWTENIPKDGYPRLTYRAHWRVPQLVHRIAYAMAKGHPLDDLGSISTLDHLCRTPACSAAAHLEPKTRAENVLLGNPNQNERKEQCDKGHPFSRENTYVTPKGRRNCRECKRESTRESWRRKHRPDLVGKNPTIAGRPKGGVIFREPKPGRKWNDGT